LECVILERECICYLRGWHAVTELTLERCPVRNAVLH
jgi:hypothetical protein